MTQAEKTEAVILDAYSASDLSVVTGKVEAHARDLARKWDAVKAECNRVMAVNEPYSGSDWARAEWAGRGQVACSISNIIDAIVEAE